MIWLVDSNVYVRAFRDAAFGEWLRRFHQAHVPELVLSVVVAHELAVGAVTTAKERALLRNLVEPFRVRQRLHVPARHTWILAGRTDRRLRRRAALASKLKTRSFANDLLIAASARELGATILTENSRDFALIATAIDIRFKVPLSDAPGS